MKHISKTLCLVIAVILVFSAVLTSCSSTSVAPRKSENKAVLKTDDKEQEPTANTASDTHPETEEGQYFNVMQMEWPDRSLEEIVGGADYIVRAKNVGHGTSYRNEDSTFRMIYTDYTFEILESFKGDRVVGDTVTVKWYGGELDGEKSVVAGETPINEGQEYILILSHDTDENDELTDDDRYVYYPPRGILADDGNGVFTAQDPAVSYTAAEFRAAVEAILG